ncbi:minichromosome maintenance protein 5 [Gurleya vavrai]
MSTTLDLLSDNLHTPLPNIFINFIESFHIYENFIYQSMLTKAILTKSPIIIKLPHISLFSSHLHDSILSNPSIIFEFEEKLFSIYKTPLTLHFTTDLEFSSINLNSNMINKIVRIRGIIISISLPILKPKKIFLTCKKCLATKEATTYLPRTCESGCGIDPFYIDPDKSTVIDEQYVKIQEMFEDIKPGEMPKHFTLVLEKSLVDSLCPGEKTSITGILQMRSNLVLKVLGIEKEKRKKNFYFSEDEIEKFREISENKKVNEILLSFFAPQIHGHKDIKKAILNMLFGGTKRNKHGVSLRGDLNILLLGDPGTAKSQLLKFTNLLAPGVYTSGKGSSAAGLTASVIKNKRGEFYLEGGALVLSDNGVCCIDEFDKMDLNDRVAIHEAMEQQTISINKAGINTQLNTRVSILAAANPVFGRFDEFKSFSENCDFSTTIMSRFDCIFMIKDVEDRKKDIRLAKHILEIHKKKENESDSDHFDIETSNIKNVSSFFNDLGLNKNFTSSIDFLSKYISYARNNISPCLSESAKEKLSFFYIETRKKMKDSGDSKKIPITVRQLESLIRLSESNARMHLREIVNDEDVFEAIRIFSNSTVHAANQGNSREILSVSEKIKKIVNSIIGVSYEKMKSEVDASDEIFGRAVEYLQRNGKIIIKDNLVLRMN